MAFTDGQFWGVGWGNWHLMGGSYYNRMYFLRSKFYIFESCFDEQLGL